MSNSNTTMASGAAAASSALKQRAVNAELLAIFSIPLFASLMARGGWFQRDMPWQLGAAPVALALGGLGYKYVNEALTWEEDAGFSEEPSAEM